MSRRYIVLGAGAVGATIGGRLAESGHEVVLVARGEHAAAMRRDGLVLSMPDRSVILPVEVCEDASTLALAPDDVLVLGCKTQDTVGLLDSAVAAAGFEDQLVVCAQNGVENERIALRRTSRVAGVCVMLPATHLQPGAVDAQGTPYSGKLEIGLYPSGVDAAVEGVVADLSDSGFVATARPQVMRWKYAKLLRNCGNAIQAICGDDRYGDAVESLDRRAKDEGLAVLAAAGIDVVGDEEWDANRGQDVRIGEIAGRPRTGGSSWQSIQRGLGTVESDYLNGEIVLLGRQHGVATPVNATLGREASRLARRRGRPGEMTAEALLALVDGASGGAGRG